MIFSLAFWISLIIAKNHQKVPFFQKYFFREKVQKISFRVLCSDCSNSSWLFFSCCLKFVPNLNSDALGYNVHQSVFLDSCAGSAVKTHSFECIEVRKLQKYQVEKNYFFPKIFIFSFSRFGIFHSSHIYS